MKNNSESPREVVELGVPKKMCVVMSPDRAKYVSKNLCGGCLFNRCKKPANRPNEPSLRVDHGRHVAVLDRAQVVTLFNQDVIDPNSPCTYNSRDGVAPVLKFATERASCCQPD